MRFVPKIWTGYYQGVSRTCGTVGEEGVVGKLREGGCGQLGNDMESVMGLAPKGNLTTALCPIELNPLSACSIKNHKIHASVCRALVAIANKSWS